MTHNDSDIHEKTSGFGIGELGRTPEYDPADIFIQHQPPASRTTATGRWELEWRLDAPIVNVIDLDAWKKTPSSRSQFDSLEALVSAARELPDGFWAYLGGPDYTVGNLNATRENFPTQLTWRRQIRLDQPVSHCEECGGAVKNGRCTRCGERDMIAVSWHQYEEHVEVKSTAGQWIELDSKPIDWARDDNGRWHYRAIVAGRLSEWIPLP